MQVDEHMQAVFTAPCKAVSQVAEAGFQDVAVLILQNIVVNGEPDMVKAETGNIGNILPGNKCAEVIVVVPGKL